MELGGGSLNVTKQIYFDHPNITLTHIHIAYANVSCCVRGTFRGWPGPCGRHELSLTQSCQGGCGLFKLGGGCPWPGQALREGALLWCLEKHSGGAPDRLSQQPALILCDIICVLAVRFSSTVLCVSRDKQNLACRW